MATYYIDFATGSDANNGTAKGTPWKHQPYMQGWTGSGYSHSAGDRFIFKGGVAWDHTCFSLVLSTGGTSGNIDYYGVDKTWYSGGNWTRPIFDGENETLASGADTDIINLTTNYVTIDNIEIRGLYVNSDAFGVGCIAGYIATANGITVQNCYIHDWSIGPGVVTGGGGAIFMSITSVPANDSFVVDSCTISNADQAPTLTAGTSSTSVAIGTGTKTFTVTGGLSVSANDRVTIYDGVNAGMSGIVTSFTGGTLVVSVKSILGSGTMNAWTISGPASMNGIGVRQVSQVSNCVIHDVPNALLFVGQIFNNTVYNINWPNAVYDVTTHTNLFYIALWNGGSTALSTPANVYNNLIHDIDPGAQIYCEPCFGNNDGTMYVYNNVLYNNNQNGGGGAILLDPEQGTGAAGTVYVYNNTLATSAGGGAVCIHAGFNHSGTNNIKTAVIQNNHLISSSTTGLDVSTVTNLTADHNLPQTTAVANGQGYIVGNNYAPTLGGSTIGAGTNESGTFTTDILGVTRNNPWDIGAYQFIGQIISNSYKRIGRYLRLFGPSA